MFGEMLTLPPYLQIVKCFSPTMSGLSLLPMMVGMMVATAVGGAFSARIGKYKIFLVIGVALMAISLLGASQLGVGTATWLVVLIILLLGAGVGLNIQMLITAITNDVPAGDIGVATALATFFRQIGGTIGAAVFLSVIFDTGGRIIAAFDRARGSAASRPRSTIQRFAPIRPTRSCCVAARPDPRSTSTTPRSCTTWIRGWPALSWTASPARWTWSS